MNQKKEKSSNDNAGSWKDGWEYKSLRFIGRAVMVLVFLAYLLMAAGPAWQWAKLKWVRSQPVADVVKITDDAIAAGTPEDALLWMQMRPREDRAEIMRLLEPSSGKLSAQAFIIWSSWRLDEDEGIDAAFWRQYGLFRLRYDALRCGAPQSVEKMMGLIALGGDNVVTEIMAAHPDNVPYMIGRVLDFDAKHPAENVPTDTCATIYAIEKGNYAMVPREKWPMLYSALRRNTRRSLLKMQAPQKPAQETPGKKAPEKKD